VPQPFFVRVFLLQAYPIRNAGRHTGLPKHTIEVIATGYLNLYRSDRYPRMSVVSKSNLQLSFGHANLCNKGFKDPGHCRLQPRLGTSNRIDICVTVVQEFAPSVICRPDIARRLLVSFS
jgi:hypothetical protein